MTESTYGRACLQCFKSKSKCVVRSGSESCERCHRLKKQCSPADSIRKRNTPRGSAARTAKLEEKLDGIVSLLQSVTGSTTLPLPLPNGPTPVAIVGDSPTLYQQSMNSFSTPVSSSADDCEPQHSKVGSWGSTNPNKTSLHSSHTQPLSADEPHPNKAENDLAIFRSDMLPTFAFMNLSPSVSARELGQTRPILLQSIMVVTSTTVQRKNHLSTEFLKTLTHDVFVLHRGHLDHLLGILIFLAWGNDNSNKNHLIQLGMSLALDLRLNKPLIDEGAHKFARMVGCDSRVLSGVHTLEERRAVLGCFFMSSLSESLSVVQSPDNQLILNRISSFMGRIDPLHWTSQMDEHLRVIEESKECIADEGFAIQIRLQLLQYRSSQMRDFEGENSQRSKISSTFQLKALQAQLHDIKASISHRLQQDISIMSSYHYTEVSICERAFPAHTPISCSTTGLQHLQCMCDCLSATKSFIDLLFSMPQAGYLGMPLHYRMQCMRCLAALYRLSVHEDPGWDKQAVRNTIDLMAVFDRIIINLEQRSAGIENPDEDVMIQVCKVMKGFRAFCSTKLVQEETLMGENSGQAMSDPDIPPYFMDLTDDSWLQDVLGWSVY